MNVGYQFYRGYFEGFDFEQIQKNRNKELIAIKNNYLFSFQLENSFPLYLKGIKELTQVKTIKLRTTYPGLLMGTGYTHEIGIEGELKLGFSFDHTTGVPFIPGSSIKGIIRDFFPKLTINHIGKKRYFPELLTTDEIQKAKIDFLINAFETPSPLPNGLTKERYIHQLELFLFEGIDPNKVDINDCFISRNRVVSFFDAFPVSVEKTILQSDSLAPHKGTFEDPIPLPFLKIGSGVELNFMFLIPELPTYFGIASEKLMAFFEKVLLSSGIGAKTNVGYGRLEQISRNDTNDMIIMRDVIQATYLKKNDRYEGKVVGIENDMVFIEFESTEKVKNRTSIFKNIIQKAINKIEKSEHLELGSKVTIIINAEYKKNVHNALNVKVCIVQSV